MSGGFLEMTSVPSFPVVLCGFNRPQLTARVFEVIRQWRPRDLYLILDGPRVGHPNDVELIEQVKTILRGVDWPCRVHRDFASANLGLKTRISGGLSSVFSTAEAAIILEDDCVPDLTFFRFAEELLERYRHTTEVGLIGGTSRLRGRWESEYSYGFSSDVRIWGWATWARTWNEFISSGNLDSSWDADIRRRLVQGFPKGARRSAIASMVESAGDLDSWALPFAIHCRSRSYLSVVPEVNLIENVGFGALSTHTKFEDYVSQVPASSLRFPLRHPGVIDENPEIDRLESELDAKERMLYPLRHPFDTLGRLVRYFFARITSRRTRS